MNKYFNSAIIGNGKSLGCLDEKAELIRLYYPNIDYFQNIHTYSLGFVFDSENKVYWFKDAEKINQYYDGNIVYTKLTYGNIENHFDLEILIKDYFLIEKNIMIRKIKTSEPVSLLVHSRLNSSVDKLVSSMCVQNTLIQYSQDLYMATFSKQKISKSQVNNLREKLAFTDLNLDDYIGMSDECAALYEESKETTLYICLQDTLKGIFDDLEWLMKNNEDELSNDVRKYWREYLDKHLDYYVGNLKFTNKEIDIIERTILMYALLSNK